MRDSPCVSDETRDTRELLLTRPGDKARWLPGRGVCCCDGCGIGDSGASNPVIFFVPPALISTLDLGTGGGNMFLEVVLEEVEVISVDLTGLSSESATVGRKLDGL
jgi:hypothetical protein